MIQAIHQWRIKRARRKLLTLPLRLLPTGRLKPSRPRATTAAVLAVANLINAYVAPVSIPKELFFDLKSSRRALSSKLSIRIHLKR